MEKKKQSYLIIIGVIAVLIVGYFTFFNSISFGSKMTSKEISELALDLSDLPEGYKITERTLRTKSEISEEGVNLGWKEGYFVKYTKGEDLFDTSIIELSISKYPLENITNVLDYTLPEIEGYTLEEFPNLHIGDNSKAVRYTNEEFGLKLYIIEFTNKDIFMRLQMSGTATDYELLKELVNKAESKI